MESILVYENNLDLQFGKSVCIVDRSGWQPMAYAITENKININAFLDSKNIDLSIVEQAIPEFSQHIYAPDLLAGPHTVNTTSSLNPMIFSTANGAISNSALDKGKVVYILEDPKSNKKVDSAQIEVASELSKKFKTFVLTNDGKIVKKLKQNKVKSLRPTELLCWMVDSNFITLREASKIYNGWSQKDPGWTIPNTKFNAYYQSYKSTLSPSGNRMLRS